MQSFNDLNGFNAAYAQELLERFQRDPRSVDTATREYFEVSRATHGQPAATAPTPAAIEKIVGAVNLAQAIRFFGFLGARLDPLGTDRPGDPSLDPATHGITNDDLTELPAWLIGGPVAQRCSNALEAIEALRRIHSGSIGYDYDHVHTSEERTWLGYAVESRAFMSPSYPLDHRALLDRLTQVEVFEQFLHRVFPGKFRFSLEGLDMLVPMLDEVVGEAAELGFRNIMMGMAHRGRLNILAHVLKKAYTPILAEFKDPFRQVRIDTVHELGWTGDVKYHLGQRRSFTAGMMVDLQISMPPNPSHLESINPVVQGMARAAGTMVDQPGEPRIDTRLMLPIMIHGDAAFAGQGIVAESLNMGRLPGYHTGGAIHIIANNQLGFTTGAESGRSTLHASDLAKGFDIPIVHVNADDPEACIEVARLAINYLARFQKDFLIDLVGYRRYGHNEGDEPTFTQPEMYRRITSHPTVRELFAKHVVEEHGVEEDLPGKLREKYNSELEADYNDLQPEEDLPEPPLQQPPPGAARAVVTQVSVERLAAINESLIKIPEGFNVNSKLNRLLKRRATTFENADEPTIDWATAESLAFASILEDGTPIRLTGQDVERGTFSHRHAVLHDAEDGHRHVPLQSLPQARASFEIYNTPLTENAVLGFEFGYNVQQPERLVLWEAQYGDFINSAQVIVDEFLTSARSKWGQTPSLVLMLPHGYEGQGPDHSSARVERFLTLAADINMRVANCTTAAQYFHLLRRQAGLLKVDPLPLVILTPKSLLRHPMVASPPRALAEGAWQPVIDDMQALSSPESVRRLIICSGKVYVDLVSHDLRAQRPEVAIARLEQIYPVPREELRDLIHGYPNLDEVLWVQEEPENMGAWIYLQPHLRAIAGDDLTLHYLGRPRNASPAEGSLAWHRYNQQMLVEQAFEIKSDKLQTGLTWLKMT